MLGAMTSNVFQTPFHSSLNMTLSGFSILKTFINQTRKEGRSPHGIVANVLDCDIVVSKFELQSLYYVHFRTNTLRKGMDPLIP